MNKRLSSLRGVSALGMSLLLVFTSCNQASESASANQSVVNVSKTQDMTGVELFRTIFFGEGNAKEILPEVWSRKDIQSLRLNLTDDQKVELANEQRQTIQKIESLSPGFFNKFKTEIQSGSYIRVAAVIQETAGYMKRIAEEKGIDVDQMMSKRLKPNATSYQYNYSTATVSLAIGGIALVLFGFIIVFVFIADAPSSIQSQTQLAKDSYVVAITDRLAVK